MVVSNLYETDISRWAESQAAALERHDFRNLDWENLAEEIRALSRSDKRAIESHLKTVLVHLIRWSVQPERRSNSWRLSIRNGRAAIRKLVVESPSLQRYPAEVFAEALADAEVDALLEMELEMPAALPSLTLEQALDPEFLP
jgi:hypothetical protein